MPWDFWLILLVLGVLIPWRGRLRLQHLLHLPVVDTKEKLALYGSTIAFQWMLMGLVAWRAFARGLTSADLGLAHRMGWGLVVWSGVGTLLLGAFQWFNLRRVGRMTGAIPDFMRKLAERVLPHGSVEFVPYCALAVTAGVCEEFLYRGFVMGALTRAGVYPWAVIVISSVLFGLAHSYQGRSGVVGTTLMGVLFGIARLAFRSLFPVMIWHSAVDIAAGIAGPKYLLTQTDSE
ncbi:MAG: type II CAAX endopeptidase family protein [Candidatus Acidiferrum sp.]